MRPLDPRPGEPIPFRRVGNIWYLGNRPARVSSEIIEDNGTVTVVEIGSRGEAIDAWVLRERASSYAD